MELMTGSLQKGALCAQRSGANPASTVGRYVGRDPFASAKEKGIAYLPPEHYEDIYLPRNNAMAVASGLVAGFLVGFGLVWQVWWLVVAAVIVGVASIVWYGAARMKEKTIPAHVVQDDTERWLKTVSEAAAVTKVDENTPVNLDRPRRNVYGVIGVE